MMPGAREVYRVRLSSKGAVYLPREVVRRLGIREGSGLLLWVEDGKIVLIPVHDPLELALRGPKYARITVEEFERWSEEWQEKELLV